jgi:hypothetical protein
MDGLQLATGATLGKRNIETADSDESAIVVTVRNRDTGEAATFTVDPGVPALFGAWFAEVGGDQAARRVWSAGADELPGAEPIARSLTPARVEAG